MEKRLVEGYKEALRKMTPDERGAWISRCRAGIAALTRVYLDAIAVADELEDWRDDGAPDVATWLVMRHGDLPRTAREDVRVARALGDLPEVSRSFSDGEMGRDQLAAVTRMADARSDAAWAGDAPRYAASQLERLARLRRPTNSGGRSRDERFCRMRWDDEEGSLRLWAKLSLEEGAAVEAALRRQADKRSREAEEAGEEWEPRDRRLADALADVASAALGADPDPDRATVVLHTDHAFLRHGVGAAEVAGGPALSFDLVRRLSCDCRVEAALHGEGGLLGIGRASRTVPPRLLRQLRLRDQGCRFCGRAGWLHAHHVVHWVEGGTTDLENLVLLCPFHHRLVHDGVWGMRGSPASDMQFVSPTGRSVVARAPTPWPGVHAA